MLPTSYHVTFSLQKPDAMPNASGGYSDVWKVNGPGASVFALKVLRVTQQDDFHKIKKVRSSVHTPSSPIPHVIFRDSARKCWLPNKSNTIMSYRLRGSK